MFDDIELTIGEVLPSANVDAQIVPGTYQTCTDVCTCMSGCCARMRTKTCC